MVDEVAAFTILCCVCGYHVRIPTKVSFRRGRREHLLPLNPMCPPWNLRFTRPYYMARPPPLKFRTDCFAPSCKNLWMKHCQRMWTPFVGEVATTIRDPDNTSDRYAEYRHQYSRCTLCCPCTPWNTVCNFSNSASFSNFASKFMLTLFLI